MKINNHCWSYVSQFFLEWEMFQTKIVQKIKTHILRLITFFFENCVVYEITWENFVADHRRKCGACAFRDGYLRLQTHTQNIQHLLLFYCKNGCTNAPQYYVIRTLPILSSLVSWRYITQWVQHPHHHPPKVLLFLLINTGVFAPKAVAYFVGCNNLVQINFSKDSWCFEFNSGHCMARTCGK